MIQTQATRTARQELTETIILAKARKDLSFAEIVDGTGLSEAFVTAALLGQHPLPESAAKVVGEKLGLDADQVALLQSMPIRGSFFDGVPSDPTIYRFYEMMSVYGTTSKHWCTRSSAMASSAPSTSSWTSRKSKTRTVATAL